MTSEVLFLEYSLCSFFNDSNILKNVSFLMEFFILEINHMEIISDLLHKRFFVITEY